MSRFFKGKFRRIGFLVGSIVLAGLLGINMVPVMPVVTIEAMGYEIKVPALFVKGEGHLCIQNNLALAAQTNEQQAEVGAKATKTSGVGLQESSTPVRYGYVDYKDKEPADVSDYAYAVVEPSGTYEYHGNVRIRIDFFLKEASPRYNDRYVEVVDTESEEYKAGYPGEVDPKTGEPLDWDRYNKWLDGLPTTHQLNPFHSHFLHFPPDVTNAEIEKAANYHLGNFYQAFMDEWDLVAGGMRHGWDVETRVRPYRYDDNPAFLEYDTLKTECETRVEEVKQSGLTSSIIAVQGTGTPETYPATEIDVGPGTASNNANLSGDRTFIQKYNAANDTGVIDTIDIRSGTTPNLMTGVKAGTFENTSGDYYTSRDSESLGDLAAGLNQLTGLNCSISTGDYIGAYWTDGYARYYVGSGSNGYMYYKDGDQFGQGSQEYSDYLSGFYDTVYLNIYGTGETAIEDISNTPATYDFGNVSADSTYSSDINEFTITNSSGDAVDITISGTDMVETGAGGYTWTLSDTATVGEDTYGLKAGLDDDDDSFDAVVKKSETYNTLVSSLADSGTQDWGLQLLTPSSITDYTKGEMEATVTLTAAFSS